MSAILADAFEGWVVAAGLVAIGDALLPLGHRIPAIVLGATVALLLHWRCWRPPRHRWRR